MVKGPKGINKKNQEKSRLSRELGSRRMIMAIIVINNSGFNT